MKKEIIILIIIIPVFILSVFFFSYIYYKQNVRQMAPGLKEVDNQHETVLIRSEMRVDV